jgi:hypothetical protein
VSLLNPHISFALVRCKFAMLAQKTVLLPGNFSSSIRRACGGGGGLITIGLYRIVRIVRKGERRRAVSAADRLISTA